MKLNVPMNYTGVIELPIESKRHRVAVNEKSVKPTKVFGGGYVLLAAQGGKYTIEVLF